jgi:ankyrin repeat protein
MILNDYPDTDINLGGENGSAPLHYCAYGDNLECAKILLKYNAKVCMPCNNGFYPIHIAVIYFYLHFSNMDISHPPKNKFSI